MALPRFRELPSETRAGQRARLLTAVQAPRRRRYVLVAAVVLAVFAAAPTLAFQRELVDFWSAEPAPERIQLDWDKMRQVHARMRAKGSSAPSITPDGLAREVMTVMIDGELRPLSVVPTREGSFCTRLHFGASCLTSRDRGSSIGVGGLMTGSLGLDWVEGHVLETGVQEVELLYQDGQRMQVPFVWVSPPIDAGFYAYDMPVEHEQPGHLAVAVIGLDEHGAEVAHACLPVKPDELARSVPKAVALCERRQPGHGRNRP